MTDNNIKTIIALGLIAFAWVNAQLIESVGTVQMDRAYECSIQGAVCSGRFGNIRIIDAE